MRLSDGGGVVVELQACNHPRVGLQCARTFYLMGKQGWVKESIKGESQFVGVKVSGDKLADLDVLASESGRSRSALIRDAIEQYLESEVAA